jgi:ribonuclease BN (tRNA processing enzyme)
VGAAGRTLAYSGDTGISPGLVAAATGADLLLCEASVTDGRPHPPDLHLTGREAGEHAARAGVGRLLVTHVPPWTDRDRVLTEATEAFGGPTSLAAAGEVYEV